MDGPADRLGAPSLDIIPEDKRAAVRNNGGGHANHTLFWEIMGPNGGGDPSGALGDAIADTFGGVAELKAAVNDAGVKRFGSGWTWLVWDGTGLAVKSTPNQDTPVMDGDVRRSSASTCGSTPTTSTTRTAAPTTSRRGGTSSTGTRSQRGSTPADAARDSVTTQSASVASA